MTRFRPCIDLHQGTVKQIVGGTLGDDPTRLETNFESTHPAAYYARLYQGDQLTGGHVIQLGPGNAEAAREALAAYPGGLQLGGGVCLDNAAAWLSAGASHAIVTSWLFDEQARFLPGRLEALAREIGRDRLVIDLSCRKKGDRWVVAMNRWQTITDLEIDAATLDSLSAYCSEFLIHAADVEGKCEGIDSDLVALLGKSCPLPTTYAGGVNSPDDLETVNRLSKGRVDLTIGSALDIFGGGRVRYSDCVAWNKSHP